MKWLAKMLGRPGEWDWISPYAGVWLIREGMARIMVQRIEEQRQNHSPAELLKMGQALAAIEVEGEETPHFVSIQDGLGIVEMTGVMSFRRLYSGPPTLKEYAGACDLLADRDDVRTALLKIHSPGGSIFGLDEGAAAIRRLRAKKRVIVHVDEMACSAAYWLAAQADEITVTPTAEVGNIGVYAVLVDRSSELAAAGVQVVVVKSAEMKAVGLSGTAITDAMRKEIQRNVDATAELFLAAIAEGRGIPLDKAREWHDGRIHIGQAAVDLGLADRVTNYHDLIQELSSSGASASVPINGSPQEEPMLENEDGAQAAGGEESTPTEPTATSADDRTFLNQLRRMFGGLGQPAANVEPAPDPTAARLGQLEATAARLGQLEADMAQMRVNDALRPLEGKLPPAVFKNGLGDLAMELHGQGKLDQLTNVLGALPDMTLDATQLAVASGASGTVVVPALADHEKQVLAQHGIDDAELSKLAATFPAAFQEIQ